MEGDQAGAAKGTREKSQGNQTQVCKSLWLFEGSHRMRFIPPASVRCCLQGRPAGSATSLAFTARAPSTEHIAEFQAPRREAGVRHTPQCLCKEFKHHEPFLSGNGRNPPKAKFLDTSQGPALLGQESHTGYSNSVLCHGHTHLKSGSPALPASMPGCGPCQLLPDCALCLLPSSWAHLHLKPCENMSPRGQGLPPTHSPLCPVLRAREVLSVCATVVNTCPSPQMGTALVHFRDRVYWRCHGGLVAEPQPEPTAVHWSG